MWISRTNFELAKMAARIKGMDAQRAYSAAHFNGAIYDLQHELALEMNKVHDARIDNEAMSKALHDSPLRVVNQESYCVMQVDSVSRKRVPMTSDLSFRDAVIQMDMYNRDSSKRYNPVTGQSSLYYTIELFQHGAFQWCMAPGYVGGDCYYVCVVQVVELLLNLLPWIICTVVCLYAGYNT